MPLPIESFTRSRMIVSMLRYDATSAVSDSRPRPGMIHVPPCAAVLGDGEIEDVIQAVDHALDAAALVDVDDRIADRRDACRPALMTSEWRKNTRLSPSVLAAGA